MKKWFNRYALILSAIVILLVCLGCMINIAFLIVAMMYVFIIIPTALMFTYYFYALNKRTALLSLGEVITTLYPKELKVDILREDADCFSFKIPLDEIRDIIPGKNIDTIIYGNSPKDILLIEPNAFYDRTSRVLFHNYIYDYIQKNL